MSPSEILASLYNNCDPVKPAEANFYVDCTEVRGGTVFATKLATELSQTSGRIHSLFTGHIGCGKSSELQCLADKVGSKTPISGQKRFFPVIVNMSDYLDEYDVSTTDILLAVVAEMADTFRTQEGIDLSGSFLQRRWDELKGYLLSDIEINDSDVNVPWGKLKVQRLRTDPTARKLVRERLLPQTSSLLDEINLFFAAARNALQKVSPQSGGAKYADFILILDNLEKIQRIASNQPGDASQRALFIEGATQFLALDAHVVFTVPLALVRSQGQLLAQTYRRELFVLPMIKTEHRGPEHTPFESGRKKLIELLGKRLPSGVALADVFETDALDFLVEYSGGHIRNLMMYTRESTLYANGTLPIPLIAIQKAIAQTVSILVPVLGPLDWELLATLELSPRQDWDNNTSAQRRLLENLCVMEYINGGDQNPLKKTAPWYAVNPVLRVQDAFEDAVTTKRQQLIMATQKQPS